MSAGCGRRSRSARRRQDSAGGPLEHGINSASGAVPVDDGRWCDSRAKRRRRDTSEGWSTSTAGVSPAGVSAREMSPRAMGDPQVVPVRIGHPEVL